MKKRGVFSCLMSLAMTLTLGACSSEAVAGPQGEKGEAGRSVVSINKTSSDGNVDTYTITYSDGTKSTFTVTNGKDGQNGEKGDAGTAGKDGTNGKDGSDGKDGVSITRIEKTSTSGNKDTYTIYYSDGNTSSFTITNGEDGSQGIQGEAGKDGHSPVISIDSNGYWCVDGISTGIKAQGEKGDKGDKGDTGAQGEKGDKGDKGDTGADGKDGVSITKIEKTSSNGNTDIYTITYFDGSTSYFTVTNGKDGEQGVEGVAGEDGHSPVITIVDGYWYVDGFSTGVIAVGENGKDGTDGKNGSSVLNGKGTPSSSIGNDGDSYIDTSNGDLYVKNNGTWTLSMNLKGDKGDKGDTGASGKDGTSLLTGNGEPASSLGNEGDSYIDLDTWTYYTRKNGIWTSDGNIKGSDGKDGEKGETGAQGDKGDTGVSVVSTKIDDNGDLIVTFSDGTTQNAGHVADTTKYTVNYHVDDEIIKTEVVDPFTKLTAPTEEYTAGYTISSWYINDSQGKVTWDFDGYFYRVYENLDLYAEYTANTYTLSFVDTFTGNHINSIDVTYDSEYTLPSPTFTGYTIHWVDSEGNIMSDGVWRIPSNTTFYASWANNEYTVTLDLNKGTVDNTTIKVTYDKSYSLPTPTRTNYVFKGWYDSDGKKVSSNATWKRASDETFTAEWTNVTNTYNFDAGNGTCEVDNITIGWEDAYELPTPVCKVDGFIYEFKGWYLGDTLIPQSGDSWTYSNIGGTLAAKWGDVISFEKGKYPQTKVTDSTLTSTLNDKAGTLPTASDSQSWTSYKYYISGSNETDFMWYQDVTYDDEEYRGVYFTSYRPYYCGSSSSSGNTYQDENGYYSNTVYWFKWEPMEWKILEETDGDIFVVTEKLLDSQQYYHQTSGSKQTRAPYDSTAEESVYDNNYQYSDIRGWLNTDFYNGAFTSSEKSSIKTIKVDNSVSSTGYSSNSYVCEDTDDKAFLLSYKEVTNSRYGFSSDNDRIAYATDYAKCQGVYVDSSRNSSYWCFRSPINYSRNSARNVSYDGYVNINNVNNTSNGIRPALHFSI